MEKLDKIAEEGEIQEANALTVRAEQAVEENESGGGRPKINKWVFCNHEYYTEEGYIFENDLMPL